MPEDLSLNNQIPELANLINEVGEKVGETYYYAFFKFLAECGLAETDGPVPLEIWRGIAQAFADSSGYRIVLQAETLECIGGEPLTYKSTGRVEVASADPTCFVQPAGE
jgi:hypothetical protein